MTHALLEATTAAPWAYVALVAVAALDALFPVVPSEATVISAGALAGSGSLDLGLVVGAAACGAALGDNAAYAIGRLLGPRLGSRLAASPRWAGRRAWAERELEARAASLILLSRLVPCGRTATTLTAGLVALRWRRFLRLSVLAAGAWATYVSLLGFLGGATFEDRPLLGIGLALALAAACTTALSLAARRRGAIGDATDASARPHRQGR
jgi:membrane-associated protein